MTVLELGDWPGIGSGEIVNLVIALIGDQTRIDTVLSFLGPIRHLKGRLVCVILPCVGNTQVQVNHLYNLTPTKMTQLGSTQSTQRL